MRIIILTSSSLGLAAHHLEKIIGIDSIEVVGVIISRMNVNNKKKYYNRILKKAFKIGLLGVINGIRMRRWYSITKVKKYLTKFESLDELCCKYNIPLEFTPTINCEQTILLFNKANAELGLSLGNGYIGSKIFTIPKYGMINIHHEELPAYQGAQSVIWQMYNNSTYTGYTIHKIDKSIDTGEIIFQEKIPIVFRKSLKETITFNYANLWEYSSNGLVKILENFQFYFNNSTLQNIGKKYTTPNIFQFIKIYRNYKILKKDY